MPKYIIGVREVWIQQVLIEASSKEEALNLVQKGEGDSNPFCLEYSHTLDKDYWSIEEDKDNEEKAFSV